MRCKNCKEKFIPKKYLKSTDVAYKYCDKEECRIVMVKIGMELQRKFKSKEEKRATNLLKNSLKTHSDYVQELQKVFNKWIRLRDKDEPCISCRTRKNVEYAAGHLYPTTYQFLRFNEDNVHKQCNKHCNQMLRGNINEYRANVEAKIGSEKLQWLHAHRHDRFEMSIPELQEKIKEYKLKLKNK